MIEIQKTKPQLESALADFFRRINSKEIVEKFSPHEFNDEQAHLLCHFSGKDQYFLTTCRDQVVGYGMLRGWDEGYPVPSLGLCVDPQFQGFGLGVLMMQHLISVAKVLSSEKIILKVKKNNESAIRLYQKMGFELTELDQDFLNGTLLLKRK